MQAWKRRVRSACGAAQVGRPVLDGNVILRVTHFCDTPIGDVDNLVKPIQDALQGVVYINDSQVRDVIGNRRNINASFKIRFMSMVLASAFSDGHPFVHIRVWHSLKREELG